MPAPEIETRELSCELTETELLQRGDQMADAELEIEQLKGKRAEVSDAIKAERLLRRKLAGVIDTGRELRHVRCTWLKDFERNCFDLVRSDTGEVIETRAMTGAERQEALFDGDESDEPVVKPARTHLDSEPAPVSARGSKRFDS